MIHCRSKAEIARIHRAGRLLAGCHRKIAQRIAPGVTTRQIDRFVEQYLAKHGAKPEQKGYKGYPYATCASVNDVIAHGFPREEPLRSGDIVTIDMVVNLDGWLADSAWTYAVGPIGPRASRLMRITRECLALGIRKAVPGARLGDIMHAVQSHAERAGFGIVRELHGHGIGRRIHEAPTFSHAGERGKGVRLKEGMVITIEPALTEGNPYMYIEEDGWTARTWDGGLAAQYEHTVAIMKDGPLVLTDQERVDDD